jgi:cell division protein ZapA (FtsZ GTPase activity inhibitor)
MASNPERPEMVQRITIDIMGHQYSVKTDGDAAYVQRIAEYVNSKSREVMEATQTVSTLDVVMKVAINLADELFQERATKESFLRSVEEESRQLIREIDQQLEGSISDGNTL